MSTLGFAFPVGLGAKLGNPDVPVLAFCGDGGFMYAVGDMATAVGYGINLVTLVFNNGKYGATQDDQVHGRFDGRVIGTDLHNPDFAALAESFGALGLRVEELAELPQTVISAVDARRPALVEVTVDAMTSLDLSEVFV
jgi:acetolactate synthase-1/2/3 large subunit